MKQTAQYIEADGSRYYLDASGNVAIPPKAMASASEVKTETTQVEEPVFVISLSGLAVGSLIGILLNALLPGKDYVFEDKKDASHSKDSVIMSEPVKKEKKK